MVHLDPDLKRVKEKVIEFDFSWLELQGRAVKGSTLTAHKVDRVVNAPKSEEGESEGKSVPSKSVEAKDSAKPVEKPKANKKSVTTKKDPDPSSSPKPDELTERNKQPLTLRTTKRDLVCIVASLFGLKFVTK